MSDRIYQTVLLALLPGQFLKSNVLCLSSSRTRYNGTCIPHPGSRSLLSLAVISTSPLCKEAAPLTPPKDYFLSPKGLRKGPLGDILRHRTPPALLAAFGDIPLNIHSAYQIQLLTANSQSKADTAVTTVLVPEQANTSRLISNQDFGDSCSVDCATSYALHQGKKFNTGLSKSDVLFEAGLLNQGYKVAKQHSVQDPKPATQLSTPPAKSSNRTNSLASPRTTSI